MHNRVFLGAGIVDGLAVAVETGAPDAVVVSPGFAIDRLGNEILVDCPVRVEIGTRAEHTCFVALQYNEVLTDPVPTRNGIEFSRILETFSVEILPAHSVESSDILRLARLIQRNGEWLIDDEYAPPRLRICG